MNEHKLSCDRTVLQVQEQVTTHYQDLTGEDTGCGFVWIIRGPYGVMAIPIPNYIISNIFEYFYNSGISPSYIPLT